MDLVEEMNAAQAEAFEQPDGCVIYITNMEAIPEFPTDHLLVVLHPISQSKTYLETAYPISNRRLNRHRRRHKWEKVLRP